MHIEKSPPELVARFDEVLARYPEVTRRKMFGGEAAFINGNLATSLFEGGWVLRLPDADREELLGLDGAKQFEPMPGRPMTGYAILPEPIVADDAALDSWLERSFAYVRSLPAKKK